MVKLLFFLFCFNSYAQQSIFPQFDFDQITAFSPGKKVSEIPKTFGTPLDLELKDAQKVKLFKIKNKDGYTYPLLIQHVDDEIFDFYARPPSYLLHDFFHRDLIKRYGRQNEYYLENGTGYYIWSNNDLDIYYSGECTITCFPVFYSQVASKNKLPPTYKSIGKILEDNLTLFE